MKKVIVVGTGAGGATVAKELQGKCQVTILEAGGDFNYFSFNMNILEKVRKAYYFFDEKLIQILFRHMKIKKTNDKVVTVYGKGTGGSTTLSAGNAFRLDKTLKDIGINLDIEFNELYDEIPITDNHTKKWSPFSKEAYRICKEMDLAPFAAYKMGNYENCRSCGRCVLGCPYNVKWDSRCFLEVAIEKGAKLIKGCKVEKVVIEDGRVIGVLARKGFKHKLYKADMIILAAGGLGTPVILENSGIDCEKRLSFDPVLCVAAKKENSYQYKELSMPFIIQKKDYIISPYFDYLSFYFNKEWQIPSKDIVALMIKLADENKGSVGSNHFDKELTDIDKKRFKEGIEICTEILTRMGIKKEDIFLGTINAGHPAGMLPLTRDEKDSLHNDKLPENLYIADATLFPESLGNPQIFTIMALAKKISKICIESLKNK